MGLILWAAAVRRRVRAPNAQSGTSGRVNLAADLTSFDAVHSSSELLALGSVAMPAHEAAFATPKALEHHHVVLPRTAMVIAMDGRQRFIADALHLTLHNPGVPYHREAIADQADLSDYLMLSPQLADEWLHGARSFACAQLPLDARGYLRAQRLFAAARRGAPMLQLEEAAMALMAAMQAAPAPQRRRQPRPLGHRLSAVERARRCLAEHLRATPTLAMVARQACVSPFHLAHEFRRQTGLTLHAYAMALKARAALREAHAHRGELATLASELGYTDLPHLSRCFRAAFGLTPKQYLGLD